jgi:hypothetical protein
MGREAKVKKNRTCKKCGLDFIDMTAVQIRVHAFVCNFEKLTGIEIIKMGPANEDEAEEAATN